MAKISGNFCLKSQKPFILLTLLLYNVITTNVKYTGQEFVDVFFLQYISVCHIFPFNDSEKIITCNLIINEYMHLHLFRWPGIKALTLLHYPDMAEIFLTGTLSLNNNISVKMGLLL